MARPLFAIEVRLVGDSWIVLKAGRRVASHRYQRDALDHVERLLGLAGDLVEAAEVFERDGLSDDAMAFCKRTAPR